MNNLFVCIIKLLVIFSLIYHLNSCTTMPTQDVSSDCIEDVKKFQKGLNTQFSNPQNTPLTPSGLQFFSGLEFYPIDCKYKITARFDLSNDKDTFEMSTTTDRKPLYIKYGTAKFSYEEKNYELNIYQSLESAESKEYKNRLFLPFRDLTGGKESYGGGRYIDLQVPDGDSIVIDFNKAYNPYCCYNHKYSCPIPPSDNNLDIEIRAGVMAYK